MTNSCDINKPEEIYLLDLKILEGKTISFDTMVSVCELKATKHIEECEDFWDLDINIKDGKHINKLQIYKNDGYDKLSSETITSKDIIDNIALNALSKHDYGLCYIAEYMNITLMIAGATSLSFAVEHLSKPINFVSTEENDAMHKVLLSLREKGLLQFKSGELENTLIHYFQGETKIHDEVLDALILHRQHDNSCNSTFKTLSLF